MENKATIDQSSMSIAGRSLSRLTPEELRDWIKDYEGRVKREEKIARVKNGSASGNTIKVRFT